MHSQSMIPKQAVQLTLHCRPVSLLHGLKPVRAIVQAQTGRERDGGPAEKGQAPQRAGAQGPSADAPARPATRRRGGSSGNPAPGQQPPAGEDVVVGSSSHPHHHPHIDNPRLLRMLEREQQQRQQAEQAPLLEEGSFRRRRAHAEHDAVELDPARFSRELLEEASVGWGSVDAAAQEAGDQRLEGSNQAQRHEFYVESFDEESGRITLSVPPKDWPDDIGWDLYSARAGGPDTQEEADDELESQEEEEAALRQDQKIATMQEYDEVLQDTLVEHSGHQEHHRDLFDSELVEADEQEQQQQPLWGARRSGSAAAAAVARAAGVRGQQHGGKASKETSATAARPAAAAATRPPPHSSHSTHAPRPWEVAPAVPHIPATAPATAPAMTHSGSELDPDSELVASLYDGSDCEDLRSSSVLYAADSGYEEVLAQLRAEGVGVLQPDDASPPRASLSHAADAVPPPQLPSQPSQPSPAERSLDGWDQEYLSPPTWAAAGEETAPVRPRATSKSA